tara:strand:+ start:313 stop:447 length:135 start_codon:yes stop_codon:yes gene_type:complete
MENLKNKMISIIIVGLLLKMECLPGGPFLLMIGGLGLAFYYIRK